MLGACWLIGAYFLAVSSHKRGHLNTSVYVVCLSVTEAPCFNHVGLLQGLHIIMILTMLSVCLLQRLHISGTGHLQEDVGV